VRYLVEASYAIISADCIHWVATEDQEVGFMISGNHISTGVNLDIGSEALGEDETDHSR
jgi:hypothetical protein